MSRRRVLLLVGSDVTSDARVRKCAESLRRAQYDVRVLFTLNRPTSRGEFPPHLDGTPIEELAPPTLTTRPTQPIPQGIIKTIRTGGGFATPVRRQRAVHGAKLRGRELAARIAVRKLRLAEIPRSSRLAARLDLKVRTWLAHLAIRADRSRLKARREFLRYRLARTATGSASSPFQSSGEAPLHRRDARANWRRRLPDLAAMDLVFGPRIDELEPDVLHVHDYHLLPTAAEATVRARAAGRDVKLVYDAHEFVRGLTTLHDERRRAIAGTERRFMRDADAVITVSIALADRLEEDHGCARPTVVMNAPRQLPPDVGASTSLRKECGIADDVPLLVYSGNITPARGVHTLIEALGLLSRSVHLALVTNGRARYLDELLDRAVELGIRDRLHLAPYVPVDEVPAYLREATVGVHPLLHYPNAEIALPNKIFEYAHARIPVVVSDCRAQAAFVKRWGFGEVFAADDPSDLSRAVSQVLEDPQTYRSFLTDEVLDELSWEGQEPALLSLYERLLAPTATP